MFLNLNILDLTELHIVTKPVIYGQELSFVCSSNVTDSSLWYWFLNKNILFSSGLPVNDVDMNKYKENRVTENIRNLTISDFDFSDIQNYTCVHALESALLDLTSEAYTFVCKYVSAILSYSFIMSTNRNTFPVYSYAVELFQYL